jgi:Plavaka transposase
MLHGTCRYDSLGLHDGKVLVNRHIAHQDALPPGATLLETILSSDKTTISAMTRNCTAHPLLLSLANIKMEFHFKASHHTFLLLALLPVPSIIHTNKKLHGVMENRLIHECLNFTLQPLKMVASIGIMMSDPYGLQRFCFTPLAAYVCNLTEATMLADVGGKTSPITMASFQQFSDPFQHESHTTSMTLTKLQALESSFDPTNIATYCREAKEL